jgi:excisionase family DNA binding protein
MLLNVKQVAQLLGCAWRTVLRHADQGVIPWGVKIGSLRRWNEAEIKDWVANGCKPGLRS